MGRARNCRACSADRSSAWNLAPQVTQPIFTAGRLKSNVKLAEAERERALIQYEKTIQTAFTEVSDALIAHQRVRESREKQESLVAALAGPAAAGLPALSRRRGHAAQRAGCRSRPVSGGARPGADPAEGAPDAWCSSTRRSAEDGSRSEPGDFRPENPAGNQSNHAQYRHQGPDSDFVSSRVKQSHVSTSLAT